MVFLPTDGTYLLDRIRARHFVEGLKDATFGALLARDELEKRSSKTYKYYTSAGQQLILTTVSYPSWDDTVKYSDISRYFGYDARQKDLPYTPDIFINTGTEAL
ncbi:hypothetical protein GGR55DRAFT_682525 [Xylaria sp. FL0064]|nr:hypothetical protein GGR55DRAFT_682525 [Xylaria sp. FL0064]